MPSYVEDIWTIRNFLFEYRDYLTSEHKKRLQNFLIFVENNDAVHITRIADGRVHFSNICSVDHTIDGCICYFVHAEIKISLEMFENYKALFDLENF